MLYSTRHAMYFRAGLESGLSRGVRDLSAVEIAPTMPVVVSDYLARAHDALRPWVALYVGGMGSKAKNFYNETVRRYGFEAEAREIQDLYLSGNRRSAIAAVPDALIDAVALSRPPARLRERIQA